MEKEKSKKVKAALVKANDYQFQTLLEGLAKTFEHLGGLSSIIQPKSKIFLKINHLSPPSPPERAIVTHPEFTRAVIAHLQDLGCEIIVADDIFSRIKDGFKPSGYQKIAEQMGVRLINLKELGFKKLTLAGKRLQETFITPLFFECDYIVNLSKLKTHSLTTFTGAIKNFYGLIPYGLRLDYHRRFRRINEFCEMLVDIFSVVKDKVCLNLMDAIVGQEGEGPSSGQPRFVGYIIGSRDSVALDAVASSLINLAPSQVLTTVEAQSRGLGIGDLDKIVILGEKLEKARLYDFKHSSAVNLVQKRIPNAIYIFIQNQLYLTPQIITKKCTICRECIQVCPQQTIHLVDKKVKVDVSNCIHCLCCHEVCRFQAIKLKQKPIGWIFRKLSSKLKKKKKNKNKNKNKNKGSSQK